MSAKLTEDGRERRTDPRSRLTLKVEYPSADGFLQDYTVNISRGGTMLRTQREVEKGDTVAIELSFPGLLSPLRMTGDVRWVRPEGPDEQTVGVAFDLQSTDVRERLEQLVDSLRRNEAQRPTRTINILVVEDNPRVAQLIRDGLAGYRQRRDDDLNYITAHARDGREALGLMLDQPLDLLIVDIYLPVMDGGSLIRTIRKDPRWSNLPIIAVSAGSAEARQIATRAGADFFLEKPFRLADVVQTMHRLLAHSKRRSAGN